jgi:N-acetylmuramoyl-L-alanine amidase
MKIAISSGHGKYIRGAEGYLDEVDEARRVVNEVAERLKLGGHGVYVFHDDESHSQSENLDRIVDWHNSKSRDLDVSVHFNAYETTSEPMGVEVLYVSKSELASDVSEAISAAAGFKNRGPKKRTDLAFLNGTDEPAILIETCFVDSRADADLYDQHFLNICAAITASLTGSAAALPPPVTEPDPPTPGDVSVPVLTITVDPPNSVKIVIK